MQLLYWNECDSSISSSPSIQSKHYSAWSSKPRCIPHPIDSLQMVYVYLPVNTTKYSQCLYRPVLALPSISACTRALRFTCGFISVHKIYLNHIKHTRNLSTYVYVPTALRSGHPWPFSSPRSLMATPNQSAQYVDHQRSKQNSYLTSRSKLVIRICTHRYNQCVTRHTQIALLFAQQ